MPQGRGSDPWEDTIIQCPTGLDRRFVGARLPRATWCRSPIRGHYERSVPPGPDHHNDGGIVTIHNRDFMESPIFKATYQRGVKATGTD